MGVAEAEAQPNREKRQRKQIVLVFFVPFRRWWVPSVCAASGADSGSSASLTGLTASTYHMF